MKVKVRLNKDITEEEFLIATFDNENFKLGTYDIEKMKTTTLNGEMKRDLQVEVPIRNKDTVIFIYSENIMSIWDNVED